MSEAIEYAIDIPYRIAYDLTKPVPIDLIIDTLVSTERMLKRSQKFIEFKYPGLDIQSTDVLIQSVLAGSLIEDYVLRLIFKDKETLDKAKELVDTVIANRPSLAALAGMSAGIILTYGWMAAANPSPSGVNNSNNINTTIVNIGNEAGLTGDEIQGIMKSIGDMKSIAKDAVKIAAPAKLDPTSSISMGEQTQLINISSEVISEVPNNYEPPAQTTREKAFSDVDVWVYASDQDSRTKGWAGIAPNVFEHRVQVELDDSINPVDLHGVRHFKADIVVTEKFNQRTKAFNVSKMLLTKTNIK